MSWLAWWLVHEAESRVCRLLGSHLLILLLRLRVQVHIREHGCRWLLLWLCSLCRLALIHVKLTKQIGLLLLRLRLVEICLLSGRSTLHEAKVTLLGLCWRGRICRSSWSRTEQVEEIVLCGFWLSICLLLWCCNWSCLSSIWF